MTSGCDTCVKMISMRCKSRVISRCPDGRGEYPVEEGRAFPICESFSECCGAPWSCWPALECFACRSCFPFGIIPVRCPQLLRTCIKPSLKFRFRLLRSVISTPSIRNGSKALSNGTFLNSSEWIASRNYSIISLQLSAWCRRRWQIPIRGFSQCDECAFIRCIGKDGDSTKSEQFANSTS